MNTNMMDQRREITFGMGDHYGRDLIPLAVWGRQRVISEKTPVFQEDDQYFLLVTSGTGTISINHISVPVKRGTLICMGPFHAYRVIPDDGCRLGLLETHISPGAYMYVLACPYFRAQNIAIPDTPIVVHLDDAETAMAESSMIQFLHAAQSEPVDHKLCFLFTVRLFGLLISNVSPNKLSHP